MSNTQVFGAPNNKLATKLGRQQFRWNQNTNKATV